MCCREIFRLQDSATTDQDIIDSSEGYNSEALTSWRCRLPSCLLSSALQLRCQTKGLMWLLIGTKMLRPASDVTRLALNLQMHSRFCFSAASALELICDTRRKQQSVSPLCCDTRLRHVQW